MVEYWKQVIKCLTRNWPTHWRLLLKLVTLILFMMVLLPRLLSKTSNLKVCKFYQNNIGHKCPRYQIQNNVNWAFLVEKLHLQYSGNNFFSSRLPRIFRKFSTFFINLPCEIHPSGYKTSVGHPRRPEDPLCPLGCFIS